MDIPHAVFLFAGRSPGVEERGKHQPHALFDGACEPDIVLRVLLLSDDAAAPFGRDGRSDGAGIPFSLFD